MNFISKILFYLSKFSLNYFFIDFDKYTQFPNFLNKNADYIVYSPTIRLPNSFLTSFKIVSDKDHFFFLNSSGSDDVLCEHNNNLYFIVENK